MPDNQDRQTILDLLQNIAAAIGRTWGAATSAEKHAKATRTASERAGSAVGATGFNVFDGLRPSNAKAITSMLSGKLPVPVTNAHPQGSSPVPGSFGDKTNPIHATSLTAIQPTTTTGGDAEKWTTSANAGTDIPLAKPSVWERRAMRGMPPRERGFGSQTDRTLSATAYMLGRSFGVLTKTLMGAAGLVSAVAAAGKALFAFSTKTVENNRGLTVYSARLATTYAKIDFAQRLRDLDLARKTQTSAVGAAEQWNKASDDSQWVRVQWNKFQNNLSTAAAFGVRMITNPLNVGGVARDFGKMPTSDKIEVGLGAAVEAAGAAIALRSAWKLGGRVAGSLGMGGIGTKALGIGGTLLRGGYQVGAELAGTAGVAGGAGAAAVAGGAFGLVSAFYSLRDAVKYGAGKGGAAGGYSDTLGGWKWNPFSAVIAWNERKQADQSTEKTERLIKALDKNTLAQYAQFDPAAKAELDRREDAAKSDDDSNPDNPMIFQGHLKEMLDWAKPVGPVNQRPQ